MVDTNALLSIAFTLISNFTNLVQVEPQWVPQTREDLQTYVVGSPVSPVDVFMRNKSGARFSVHRGAVTSYSSPDSYFSPRMPVQLSRYKGESKISEQEAVQLAAETFRRLQRNGDPLATSVPRVQRPSSPQFPFFKITWEDTNQHLSAAAEAEIDGRTGQILSIHLYDAGFTDRAMESRIKEKVYTADPIPKVTSSVARKRVLPCPTTNQAIQVIGKWLDFCKGLDLETGGVTNLDQINWESSLLCTDRVVSASTPVCRIAFTNKALFESVGGLVFNHFGADAFYTGDFLRRPKSDRDAISGKVIIKWQDLAKDLEGRLANNLGVPKARLDTARAVLVHTPAAYGGEGLTRAHIEWRAYHRPDHDTDAEEFPLLFAAEVDVRSGKTKWISFYDLSLLGWKDPPRQN